MKKLNWFYRISIWTISLLLACNILVKAAIWFTSLEHSKEGYRSPIHIRKQDVKARFVTKPKQKLFNKVDHLLTPAFTILFVAIAVKLVNTPRIFEEND